MQDVKASNAARLRSKAIYHVLAGESSLPRLINLSSIENILFAWQPECQKSHLFRACVRMHFEAADYELSKIHYAY